MRWKVGTVGLQQEAVERHGFRGQLKTLSVFIAYVAGKGNVVAQGACPFGLPGPTLETMEHSGWNLAPLLEDFQQRIDRIPAMENTRQAALQGEVKLAVEDLELFLRRDGVPEIVQPDYSDSYDLLRLGRN